MTNEKAKELLENISAYDIDSQRGKDKQAAIEQAIRALEQVNCEDAISRQATINAIANTCFWLSGNDWNELMDCINSLPLVTPRQTKWIPVSERLPKDFGRYLITLENGDVCQCEFNPDFWDEDNNREGAFTYYQQYFDPETLGMIDEEEIAVDAIAWMPFNPYVPNKNVEKMEESEE